MSYASLRHAPMEELARDLPPHSIDAIITDPPYGVLRAAWDTKPDLPAMWALFEHALKQDGIVVMTATMPFAAELVMSNRDHFKYEWIWHKSRGGGRVNAHHAPLSFHEHVLVFSRGGISPKAREHARYFPQGLRPSGRKRTAKQYGAMGSIFESGYTDYTQEYEGYPGSILAFANEPGGVHSTQKPEALMRYLVRTYTRAGEVVLDPYAGSATTGVACLDEGRDFYGYERDAHIYALALARLDARRDLLALEKDA